MVIEDSRAMYWLSYKPCYLPPQALYTTLTASRLQIPVKFSWGGPRFEILVVISYP